MVDPSYLERLMSDWHHYIPFATLITQGDVPANRPATTRILEQAFVGIVAAAISSYATLQVHQEKIASLEKKAQETQQQASIAVKESEIRLTQQIAELRLIMLQKANK